ncbi:C2H2 finger domain transcription factor mtfA [Mycena sanguinolenta]|uniref:C2H2 finger domain transcription factor mtfA n=1 Tax=Mycena sanguinolenta TaxID=230812 RepID=A0A8H6XB43_9AGAR|nr:C2H2 finger domain transcription factor mtfA [Mycena sanguinolenta]
MATTSSLYSQPAVVLPSLSKMFPEHLGARPTSTSRSGTPLPISIPNNPYSWHAESEAAFMDSNSPYTLEPGVLKPEDTDDARLMAMGGDVGVGGGQTSARRRRSASSAVALEPEPRKHVCYTCGKTFMRPSSLRIHANTHTGAKPYECPVPTCRRAFSVNSNMRRHFRSHGTSASVEALGSASGLTKSSTSKSTSTSESTSASTSTSTSTSRTSSASSLSPSPKTPLASPSPDEVAVAGASSSSSLSSASSSLSSASGSGSSALGPFDMREHISPLDAKTHGFAVSIPNHQNSPAHVHSNAESHPSPSSFESSSPPYATAGASYPMYDAYGGYAQPYRPAPKLHLQYASVFDNAYADRGDAYAYADEEDKQLEPGSWMPGAGHGHHGHGYTDAHEHGHEHGYAEYEYEYASDEHGHAPQYHSHGSWYADATADPHGNDAYRQDDAYGSGRSEHGHGRGYAERPGGNNNGYSESDVRSER